MPRPTSTRQTRPSPTAPAPSAAMRALALAVGLALVERRRAAVEERADGIIVGASAEYDAAFASAVQLARLPVLFTLPVAEPAVAGGGSAFALAPTPADLAKAALDDAAARTVLT